MKTLIVVTHPDPNSLTHSLAQLAAQEIRAGSADWAVEVADLYQEKFDPLFSMNDLAAYQKTGLPPSDVLKEQARLDRMDALVLVFPVHWWSMPAMLKGWIDRVMTNGWAFDWSPDVGMEKKLKNLKVYILCLGGSDGRTYQKHGYTDAMERLIPHGIFNFIGAEVKRFELISNSEDADPRVAMEVARSLARAVTKEG